METGSRASPLALLRMTTVENRGQRRATDTAATRRLSRRGRNGALKSPAGFDRFRSLHAGARPLPQGPAGEVAEWLKAHAWNACKG